jgi:hypothetical protein
MSACLVQAFTANPPLNQPDCQAVITPGAKLGKQAIDPSRPLSDYLTCARAVTQFKTTDGQHLIRAPERLSISSLI